MKIRLAIFLFLGLLLGACNEHKVTTSVPGCTDPNSLNYNAEADVDDGTCLVPQQKQYGFVLEYTASWCGPCGDWGAPKMHELYKLGNVIGIACHGTDWSADPMYLAGLYASFTSDRDDNSAVPTFWVGDIPDGEISDMNTLKQRTPVAGVVFTETKNGNKLEVKTMTQFFSSTSGDYYLSVYLMESGIDGGPGTGAYEQAGTSEPDYKHDLVLRACATGDEAYGEKIATGNIQKDAQIRKDYSLTIDPSWTNTVYAVAVLWKKGTGTPSYEFVNAYEIGNHLSH